MHNILRVIVGSQAHGLATPESDFDYRGVFVQPTAEILRIGGSVQETRWIEGKEDDTSWEIGKFLFMATKCNPTILEVLAAPIDQERHEETTEEGRRLRALLPYLWNSQGVKDAFIGYGLNQRKKFLDNKDGRADKYACAYLRVLYQAKVLLGTGELKIDMRGTPIYETLKRFKSGDYRPGEVIEACFDMETSVLKAFEANKDKKTDLTPVNDFLLDIRRKYF